MDPCAQRELLSFLLRANTATVGRYMGQWDSNAINGYGHYVGKDLFDRKDVSVLVPSSDAKYVSKSPFVLMIWYV